MDISKYPKIWCSNCRATRPLICHELERGGRNDHDAVDLVCDACKLIIATLHADPVSPDAALASIGRTL